MDWGIASVKDVIEVLAYIVQLLAAAALIVAIYTYRAHRNQLSFDVMASCVVRFQEIMPSMLQVVDEVEKGRAKKRYVDLCNEQLFYFGEKYLPHEVAREWVDGMLNFLPLFDGEGKVRPGYCDQLIEPELLEDYPRIRGAFTVEDPNREPCREDLIELIKENARKKRLGAPTPSRRDRGRAGTSIRDTDKRTGTSSGASDVSSK